MSTTIKSSTTLLTSELVKGVKDKLDEIRLMLPYAAGLSARDRMINRALGSRSTQFVQQSVESMKQNPSLVPAFVDAAEAETNYSMYNNLLAIRDSVVQLERIVGDAMHMSGTLANKQSLDFYNSVKRGAKSNVPGAQAVLENLKPRFKNVGRAKTKKTDTDAGGKAPEQ